MFAFKTKRVFLPLGISFLSVAAYQGLALRSKYDRGTKLEPPRGPHSGLESWIDKVVGIKEDLMHRLNDETYHVKEKFASFRQIIRQEIESREKIQDIKDLLLKEEIMKEFKEYLKQEEVRLEQQIRSSIEKFESIKNDALIKLKISKKGTINQPSDNVGLSVQESKNNNNNKVELVVIGDSLASGVGCDPQEESPVFPKVLAKVLSNTLHREVEWRSQGIIGATVQEIRERLLPGLKKKLLEENATKVLTDENEPSELVFVVICGLNDWKQMFLRFPFGVGIFGFKNELNRLIDEIKDLSAAINKPCKIFLPRMPIECMQSDPNCPLRISPLNIFVWGICFLWDMQKLAIENDDENNETRFIDAPDIHCAYATPGSGVVSPDGVHPSSKGYTWWAIHIGEKISDVLR